MKWSGGSNDGGFQIHKSSDIESLLKRTCELLNLKSHRVRERKSNTNKEVHGPVRY